MEYQVSLAARAQRDLLALFEKLNVEDSTAAALWFQGLEKSILSLRRLPLRCPVATERKKNGAPLRHLLYGKKPDVYRVIFDVNEAKQQVFVITIRHGARGKFSGA